MAAALQTRHHEPLPFLEAADQIAEAGTKCCLGLDVVVEIGALLRHLLADGEIGGVMVPSRIG